MEEEWKAFRNAFVGVAEDRGQRTEELCGRTSGSSSGRKKQTWWTEEVAKAIGEKRAIWKIIGGIKENGEQPNATLQQLNGQKKKAARRAVDKSKREMEDELHRQLEE